MPKMPPGSVLGLQVTGDLGGITYVQKGGQYRTAFVKTYPARALTPAKQQAIDNFRAAALAWKSLDEPHKQCLRDIERHYRLTVYGRNAFIGCHIAGRLDIIVKWAAGIGFEW